MKPSNYPQEPSNLWQIFYDFTQIPRPSGCEDQVIQYIENRAKDRNFEFRRDEIGNIVVYIPGTKGRESEESVMIQNHVDMVTDAIAGKKINFKEDVIETVVDGDWLTAVGTTLGADNGIGCAAALAVAFEDDVSHPPLELLFTVDEETGLGGALGLDASLLKSKRMINLDTEEWGSLYIGCAGGIDYDFKANFETKLPILDTKLRVEVSGLFGGHSGIDIHLNRLNSNKVLTQFLYELSQVQEVEIQEFRGGKAHNIIPRDSYAIIRVSDTDKVLDVKELLEKRWASFANKEDQNINLEIEILETKDQIEVLTLDSTKRFLSFMTLFPHGAHSIDYNADEPVVGTSNNHAITILMNGEFYTLTSLRFFDREQIRDIEQRLQSLSEMLNIEISHNSEYPSWKPSKNNHLLEQVKRVYKSEFEKDAEVKAIHAGLECGIIRDKVGPIDAISFGPNITGAHSPDERVQISSVNNFWKLFKDILANI